MGACIHKWDTWYKPSNSLLFTKDPSVDKIITQKMILTSKLLVEHPFSGQNTHHTSYQADALQTKPPRLDYNSLYRSMNVR